MKEIERQARSRGIKIQAANNVNVESGMRDQNTTVLGVCVWDKRVVCFLVFFRVFLSHIVKWEKRDA